MKSINRVTVLNIISTVLVQGITFLTIPLFSKMLGTEQYGMYSVFHSWVGILSCIMGAGVGASLGTGIYEFKDEYYSFRSGVLLWGTIICAIVAGSIILFINPIAVYLDYSYELVILLVFVAVGNYVIDFVQKTYIYEKKPEMNLLISIFISITTVVLSIVLISNSVQESRYIGRIYGGSIPSIFLAIIMWLVIFLKKPTKIQKKYGKYSILIGFPVVFHILAHNILAQSDRVMMQKLDVSNSEIGIYSLFYSFVSVMTVILGALNNSWCPFYYDDLDKKNWESLKTKYRNYIELFTVLTVGFLLLAREVGYLFADREYWEGIDIIPILVCGVFFTFMYQFPVNFEFFHKKTRIISIGTVAAAIVNVLLNLLMIPKWGMYGATMATAISYGLLYLAHYYIVSHMKESGYHLKFIAFLPSLVSIGITIVLFYLLSDYWYIRWGLGLIIGVFEVKKIIKRKTIF